MSSQEKGIAESSAPVLAITDQERERLNVLLEEHGVSRIFKSHSRITGQS